ncbi:hypothetical protein DM02DRAFT_609883, partial [Periconia macrospinosa]
MREISPRGQVPSPPRKPETCGNSTKPHGIIILCDEMHTWTMRMTRKIPEVKPAYIAGARKKVGSSNKMGGQASEVTGYGITRPRDV